MASVEVAPTEVPENETGEATKTEDILPEKPITHEIPPEQVKQKDDDQFDFEEPAEEQDTKDVEHEDFSEPKEAKADFSEEPASPADEEKPDEEDDEE